MHKVILIVLILVVAATAATIMIGTMTFEGTVVKDPYETGLRWDQIQRQRRESGWDVTLLSRHFRTGRNNIALSALDRQGHPLRDAIIDLRLERPSTARDDRVVRALQSQDGTYHATFDIPASGTWTAKIIVSQGTRTIEFEDTLFVQ
jgi:nitrogen fixation protein FixH